MLLTIAEKSYLCIDADPLALNYKDSNVKNLCGSGDVVCGHHFYFDDIVQLPVMDSLSQFSAALAKLSPSLQHVVLAVALIWISQF